MKDKIDDLKMKIEKIKEQIKKVNKILINYLNNIIIC